jgi:hypothetical protein
LGRGVRILRRYLQHRECPAIQVHRGLEAALGTVRQRQIAQSFRDARIGWRKQALADQERAAQRFPGSGQVALHLLDRAKIGEYSRAIRGVGGVMQLGDVPRTLSEAQGAAIIRRLAIK